MCRGGFQTHPFQGLIEGKVVISRGSCKIPAFFEYFMRQPRDAVCFAPMSWSNEADNGLVLDFCHDRSTPQRRHQWRQEFEHRVGPLMALVARYVSQRINCSAVKASTPNIRCASTLA